MKIQKTVNTDVEVEVEITLEDIVTALEEQTDSIDMLRCINDFGRFLKAVPDEVIAEMPESTRKIIFGFLTEQAERYAIPATISFCGCGEPKAPDATHCSEECFKIECETKHSEQKDMI